jgi:hypothetical protein
MPGFAVWTAAVDAVWWVIALEDGLIGVLGAERWRRIMRGYPEAHVLRGLRWLRHRHAHDVMVTASGGPVRDAFGGDRKPGENNVLFLSATPRWKAADDVYAPKDQGPWRKEFYEEYVAGRALTEPIYASVRWLADALVASGFDEPEQSTDPTVFGQ